MEKSDSRVTDGHISIRRLVILRFLRLLFLEPDVGLGLLANAHPRRHHGGQPLPDGLLTACQALLGDKAKAR